MPNATTVAILQQYETVTNNDSGSHWDWIELGRLYADAGQMSEAQIAAQQALDADQSNPANRY